MSYAATAPHEGHNQALTVSFVPSSLDSGAAAAHPVELLDVLDPHLAETLEDSEEGEVGGEKVHIADIRTAREKVKSTVAMSYAATAPHHAQSEQCGEASDQECEKSTVPISYAATTQQLLHMMHSQNSVTKRQSKSVRRAQCQCHTRKLRRNCST